MVQGRKCTYLHRQVLHLLHPYQSLLVVQMQGHLCLLVHGLLYLLFKDHLCQFMTGQFAPFGSPHSSPYPPVPTSTSYSGMDPSTGGTFPSVFTSLVETLVYVMAAKGNIRAWTFSRYLLTTRRVAHIRISRVKHLPELLCKCLLPL